MQHVDGVRQQVGAAGQGFVALPQHTHPPARDTRPQDTLKDGPCGRVSRSMCHHRVQPCADTGCLVCLGSRNRCSASRCLRTWAQAVGDSPCCLARARERKRRALFVFLVLFTKKKIACLPYSCPWWGGGDPTHGGVAEALWGKRQQPGGREQIHPLVWIIARRGHRARRKDGLLRATTRRSCGQQPTPAECENPCAQRRLPCEVARRRPTLRRRGSQSFAITTTATTLIRHKTLSAL